MPKDSLVDEAAKVPSRIFEWFVDGIVDGIKSQFGPSTPSSPGSGSPRNNDRDSRSGNGGCHCDCDSHKQ